MYIGGIVSHLGAWKCLSGQFRYILDDIIRCLKLADEEALKTVYSRRTRQLKEGFFLDNEPWCDLFDDRRWGSLSLTAMGSPKGFSWDIDLLWDGIGVEFCLEKQVYTESRIFVKYPLLIRRCRIKLMILLIPMRSTKSSISPDIEDFESFKEFLIALNPTPLKYPFALIGLCGDDIKPDVTELTSDLDVFLIKTIDHSLEEIILLGELQHIEFKQELPAGKDKIPENNKLAHEACAFANNAGGGLILMGIAKNGDIIGVSKSDLDQLQVRITNLIRDNLSPMPNVEFHIFDVPVNRNQSILAVRIPELDAVSKPCTVDGRVYVRIGSSVRRANSSEIRRLVLGQAI
jgi:hypothetical protein